MRECYITKELKLPRALLSCGRFANFRRVMCRYMELVVFILSAVHTTPLLYFIFVLSIFRDDASFSLLNNSIALNWPRQRAAGYMQRTARRTKIRIFAAFLHPISHLNFIRHNSNARESSCRLIYIYVYIMRVFDVPKVQIWPSFVSLFGMGDGIKYIARKIWRFTDAILSFFFFISGGIITRLF